MTAGQYAAPTNGATVVVNPGVEFLFLDPTGTIAACTVTLPANPVDFQCLRIALSQIVTALTVGGGTLVGTLTTLGLAGFASFVYSVTAGKWARAG